MTIRSFIKKYDLLIEIILLFGVYFLPGYLLQNKDFDAEMFNHVYINLYIIIISLPQILLMFYILYIKEKNDLRNFGIKALNLKDTMLGILYTLFILLIVLPVIFSLVLLYLHFFPDKNIADFSNKIDWRVSKPWMLPLILITCLSIGYREELFFRSYLITRLNQCGLNTPVACLLSIVLFASGHSYEGYIGIFVTGTLGFFLSLIWLKHKNLNIISIAHGIYDFTILTLTLFFDFKSHLN